MTEILSLDPRAPGVSVNLFGEDGPSTPGVSAKPFGGGRIYTPNHRGLFPEVSRAQALFPDLSRGPPPPGRDGLSLVRI